MRKFLHDYESIVTIEELKSGDEYKEFVNDYPGETFEKYLDLCMFWNNGFLTEILTNETPKNQRRDAVSLCSIYDSETGEYESTYWLSYYGIMREKRYGNIVVPYIGGW